METLSQLIAAYKMPETIQTPSSNGLIMVSKAKIYDKPVYNHRGLLLDTARNYLSLKTIERQLDAMAASKMNVLHWHITDSQSFPFVSLSVPQLSK